MYRMCILGMYQRNEAAPKDPINQLMGCLAVFHVSQTGNALIEVIVPD